MTGEVNDAVEVYDSCNEIRKKLATHLRKDGVTKAQFCRELAQQYHQSERKVQSGQLDRFKSMKGPNAGNTHVIFYAAYCYFEKLRIENTKPKGKHRQEMERN